MSGKNQHTLIIYSASFPWPGLWPKKRVKKERKVWIWILILIRLRASNSRPMTMSRETTGCINYWAYSLHLSYTCSKPRYSATQLHSSHPVNVVCVRLMRSCFLSLGHVSRWSISWLATSKRRQRTTQLTFVPSISTFANSHESKL